MRQGSTCFLLEGPPGSMVELQRCLERSRITCRRGTAFDVCDPAEDILVIQLDSGSAMTPRPSVKAWQAAGRAVLALCPEYDLKAIALAASLAADEILTTPLDEHELFRRVETLATLAGLERERRLRARLFAPYRAGRYGIPHWGLDAQPVPAVCVLGSASTERAQLMDALPAVMLSFAERPENLPPFLAATTPDLMLVTAPEALPAALDAIEAAGTPIGTPVVLAALRGPWAPSDLASPIDLLRLPAPAELIRTRVRQALRIAGLRRWLRHPLPPNGPNLLIDSLTGLYNAGLLLDYLSVSEREQSTALVALELSNLTAINARAGYAAGNSALAELGRSLARKTRADDVAAYLGAGRFAVAVPARTAADVASILHRLKHQLSQGNGGDLRIAMAAEALPVRGKAPERIERLFRDLGRLGRAA